jgi:hypothetical protein
LWKSLLLIGTTKIRGKVETCKKYRTRAVTSEVVKILASYWACKSRKKFMNFFYEVQNCIEYRTPTNLTIILALAAAVRLLCRRLE